MTKRRLGTIAAAAALSVAATLVAAPAAFATTRDTRCTDNDHELVLYSPATTCWSGRGTVNVDLFSVRSVDNYTAYDGYLQAVDGVRYLIYAHQGFSFTNLQEIRVIHLG